MKPFYIGGNAIAIVNLLWEYEKKQACKSTKAWIELRQKLFDMVSWMEYKDCGLKGTEQIDGNKINEKE
ncbi:42924_t:CDS:2, partial [Gigaspora margarita]